MLVHIKGTIIYQLETSLILNESMVSMIHNSIGKLIMIVKSQPIGNKLDIRIILNVIFIYF